jgi:hypothetical protein
MFDIEQEQDRVWKILKGWQFNRERHGSLYDRGSADSYYGRQPNAHYGGVGGGSGDRVAVADAVSVAEYMAGYEYNEQFGDKKEYA